ncbi:MAG TPA: NAD-dependent epimerase/dehydratase family protein [Lacunisphaera sp.]|nr:NAD-dependent epimerase/dehydratase family protein [Lacunisphaera sp.]
MNLPVKPLPAEDIKRILAQTQPSWLAARGQSFFIAGGTGFVGRWLLESFAHANDTLGLGMRATVLSRDPAAFAAKAPHLGSRPDITYRRGDMRTFDFPPGGFDHLIDAAADTDAWTRGRPVGDIVATVSATTRRMLDFADAAGVRNFLLVSSGAVYGRQPPEVPQVDEDYPGRPDPDDPAAAWARGKRVAEELCLEHAAGRGLAVKLARAFTFVGPLLPLDAQFAIGNFLRDAVAGGPIRVAGDGTPVRSYMYAGDLAAGLWTILFRGTAGRPYNLGSDDPITIADVARVVAEVLCPAAKVEIASRPAPGRLPDRYVPAVDRIRRELGVAATVPLRESIRQTAAWLGSRSKEII